MFNTKSRSALRSASYIEISFKLDQSIIVIKVYIYKIAQKKNSLCRNHKNKRVSDVVMHFGLPTFSIFILFKFFLLCIHHNFRY